MDERFEVVNTVAALGLYVDSLRWNDLLELLAPKVTVDYTSLLGGEVASMTREDVLARWQALLPGFTRTQHLIGGAHVTLTEGFAYVEAPVVAWHMIDDPSLAGQDTWMVGGRYEMQLVKCSGTWCILALTLAGAWEKGNLELREMATERAQTSPRDRRERVSAE